MNLAEMLEIHPQQTTKLSQFQLAFDPTLTSRYVSDCKILSIIRMCHLPLLLTAENAA